MLLFAGLGNPDQDYAGNRHNAGFLAADAISERHGFSGWKTKGAALIAEGRIGGEKIIIVKPQGFMNRSGGPVAEIARFYKIAPSDVFVFYDEIDLAPGRIRVKLGGGHGGHNGIRDIDRHLGRDYWRVRIGVGRPEQVVPESRIDIRKWVLMDFMSSERGGWTRRRCFVPWPTKPEDLWTRTRAAMSRVAYLSPAPKPPRPDSSENEETP